MIVAHNAVFEERLFAAEFARAGVATPPLPALYSLWLGQQTFDTPNHKLGTLAQHVGIPLMDAHAALGDVRATAALLPLMLDRYQWAIEFGRDPARGLFDPHQLGVVSLVTRAVAMRKGTDGWMSSLVSRLPISTGEVSDAAAEYRELLAVVLEDGKIIGDQAKALAKVAGRGGMGAEQVRGLNERFLEMMRRSCVRRPMLTAAELVEVKRAAGALAAPGYFDDLLPGTTSTSPTVKQILDVPAAKDAKVRKCGHCRTPGHYRSKCTELN